MAKLYNSNAINDLRLLQQKQFCQLELGPPPTKTVVYIYIYVRYDIAIDYNYNTGFLLQEHVSFLLELCVLDTL